MWKIGVDGLFIAEISIWWFDGQKGDAYSNPKNKPDKSKTNKLIQKNTPEKSGCLDQTRLGVRWTAGGWLIIPQPAMWIGPSHLPLWDEGQISQNPVELLNGFEYPYIQ